jgi:hypothetical protein
MSHRFVAPRTFQPGLGNLLVLHGNEKYPGTCIVKLPGTGLERSKLVSATSIVTPLGRTNVNFCLPGLLQPTENSKERDQRAGTCPR